MSEWLKSKSQETSVGEDVEKRGILPLLVGMQTCAATAENTMEVAQEIKNRTTLGCSNFSTVLNIYSKKKQTNKQTNKNPRATWMAQSVKRLISAQVMISRFVSSNPILSSVLRAQSLELTSDSVSPSLSAPPPLMLCFSVSVSLSKTKKHLKSFKKNTKDYASYVYCSVIYKSQIMEESTVYIWMKSRRYIMEYYSTIKEWNIAIAATWMELDSIMLNEINQRKTNTIWFLSYVEFKNQTHEQRKKERETNQETDS